VTHPLALICYNRPRHLARVLEALERTKPEPLYVFSDGPKDDERDIALVKKVRLILLGIKWTGPVIVTKLTNRGLAASVVGAVDYVLERHETVIVLEDDCVPGPRFYDYMAACLDKYGDHDEIMSVSGYAYRLPSDTFAGYPHDAFCFPRVETWGWATWRGAWRHYVRDGDLAGKFEEARRLGVDLGAGGADVPGLIRNRIGGRDSWSPGWLLGTALVGGLTVYPVKSHIRYIGDDGSGANMPAGGQWGTDVAEKWEARLPDDPPVYQPAYAAMKEIFDNL
jgi:glycosyltransferase involved in cell wall biosynthesis